ncbi:long polar fimbrial chaperone LpfB [Mixta theicola]|uniref:Long polar fimbrial chaperone LpfB n=1 Tax=Mixta theicola TaxID=1458355 RepID=A0A2K1Q7B8_9GAMM|nr:molecular chaperone [Mixta theicola]PNS10944.1 long polar fimbrial chaperone LpfB [Mixta theicola]GLR11078.1 fimbrial assembly chaperone [Mixta theicola]
MYKRIFCSLFMLALVNSVATAGVIVGGTRIIFHGEKKETAISVANPDDHAWLIQSWVESPDKNKAPFIFSPPLFRLDSQQKNVLRLIYTGTPLPQDRESLFWANIKSIPSASSEENILQIAIKTQIKLIWRPASLEKTVHRSEMAKLSWSWQQGKLQVNNPTPYYMNFHSIDVNGKAIADMKWVAPFAVKQYALPQLARSGKVSWRLINDYGAITRPFEATYSSHSK